MKLLVELMRRLVMKTNFVMIGVAIIASIIGTAIPASANLITNGSFETPTTPHDNATVIDYLEGDTSIVGWTVVGGNISIYPNNRWSVDRYLNATEGVQWIDLTGNETGYRKGLRSDLVATTVGATYNLSFDIGTHYLYPNSSLTVNINGVDLRMFTNIYDGGVLEWEHKSLTWVADSPSVTFTFLGAENGSSSNDSLIGLDNVVFIPAPVPEPATMLLLGLGLMGLVGVRRKLN